jgi:cell division protein FtsZ
MAEIKPSIETSANIKVVGVGGGGCSAVNRMVEAKIKGVEFIVMNTDIQALQISKAQKKLHIGKTVTRGLGAGMDPELGRRSAEESENEIRELLKGADMVFITCGLGGGTGSGAAPMVAEIARDLGALAIAVVTKPFVFEGTQRMDIAERAHELLTDRVDTVITVPNDRILQIAEKKTSLVDAFTIADDVLRHGVQGISEVITVHGDINVDYADVKAIMSDAGSALMGIGKGTGENRAVDAAKQAIESPLLDVSINGAKGILFVVTGGPDLGIHEVAEAAKIITGSADSNAKVIFGTVINPEMKDSVSITVIATGFEMKEKITEQRLFSAKSSYAAPAFMRSETNGSSEKNGFSKQNGNGNKDTKINFSDFPANGEKKEEAAPKEELADLNSNGINQEAEDNTPAFFRKKSLFGNNRKEENDEPEKPAEEKTGIPEFIRRKLGQ